MEVQCFSAKSCTVNESRMPASWCFDISCILWADSIFQIWLQQVLPVHMLFWELAALQWRGEVNSLPLKSGQTSDLLVTNRTQEKWCLKTSGARLSKVIQPLSSSLKYSWSLQLPCEQSNLPGLPRHVKSQSSPHRETIGRDSEIRWRQKDAWAVSRCCSSLLAQL